VTRISPAIVLALVVAASELPARGLLIAQSEAMVPTARVVRSIDPKFGLDQEAVAATCLRRVRRACLAPSSVQ